MRSFLSFVLLLCWAIVCPAQNPAGDLDPRKYANGVTVLGDTELQVRASNISRYEVLDTSRYVIRYRFDHPWGVEGHSEDHAEMLLEIGPVRTAFYSWRLYESDSLHTYHAPGKNLSGNYIRFQIYGDMRKKSVDVVQRIPFNADRAINIPDETIPRWQTDTTSCEILGLRCFRATTRFNGRHWTAWFAPEIPLAVGPWKLWGLPGLVLKAEDESHVFLFECEAIEQRAVPIRRYDWHYTQTSHDEWLKIEKRMHESPFAMFGQNTLILGMGRHKGRMDDSWTIPYYPMETE